jgi:transcriptional regulator with XRE-family HTH domain
MNQFNLGDFVFRLRESKDLSQKELGHKMLMSHTVIKKIENGETISPALNTIKELARVFNRPVEDFVLASQGIDPDAQPKDTDKEAVRKHLANIPEAQRREFMALLFGELIGVQLAIKNEVEKR